MLYMEHGVEKVTCVDCGDTQVQTKAEVDKATREAEQVIGVFEKVTCVDCGDTQVQTQAEVDKATREAEQVIGVFRPE